MDLWRRILVDALARLNASPARPPLAEPALLGSGIEAAWPSQIVYATEDAQQRARGAPRSVVNLRTLRLQVECRAAASAGVDCYAAVETYVAWARSAIDGALLDGALQEAVETATTFEMASSDRPYLLAVVNFDVQYQQKSGDPAVAG